MKEKLSRLVIKTFHITKVQFGEEAEFSSGVLTIPKESDLAKHEELIKAIEINIVEPGQYDRWVNNIMDIIPISTKVLGKLGEGITYTHTGAYVVLTGVDESGSQMADFGSSEGNLKEAIRFDRAGTPSKDDFIILVNVVLKEEKSKTRQGPTIIHRVCDKFIDQIRGELKTLDGTNYTEKRVFYDKANPAQKQVAIIKQVAGQGAMHDNLVLPDEPSGFKGGKSIIDLGNVPIVLTPNEYRDGALRAMT